MIHIIRGRGFVLSETVYLGNISERNTRVKPIHGMYRWQIEERADIKESKVQRRP